MPESRTPIISLDPRWTNVFALVAVMLIAIKVALAIWAALNHKDLGIAPDELRTCIILAFAGAGIIPAGQLTGLIGRSGGGGS